MLLFPEKVTQEKRNISRCWVKKRDQKEKMKDIVETWKKSLTVTVAKH